MRVDDVVGEAEGYVTILCVLRKPVLASRLVEAEIRGLAPVRH